LTSLERGKIGLGGQPAERGGPSSCRVMGSGRLVVTKKSWEMRDRGWYWVLLEKAGAWSCRADGEISLRKKKKETTKLTLSAPWG